MVSDFSESCASFTWPTYFPTGLWDLEVREGTSAELSGLHPHSLYRVTVKAIRSQSSTGRSRSEEMIAMAETKPALPNVAPVTSSINPSVRKDKVRT